MSLVSLCEVIGEEDFWQLVDNDLTISQKKLISVYVERSKKNF